MTQLSFKGGIKIGLLNASWPFASLTVSKNKLQISSGIVGSIVFKPEDVISIESVPGGIRLHHRVSNYNEEVIFWSFRNGYEIINDIHYTGFIEGGMESSSKCTVKDSLMHFKSSFLLLKKVRRVVVDDACKLNILSKLLCFVVGVCIVILSAIIISSVLFK